MTRYKLKELKNTSFHEQNIQQAVHAQLQQKKAKRYYHIPILSAIISVAIIFFVVSQLVPSTNKHQTAQTPTLLNVFYEIDGAGVAFSEFFKEQDQQHIRNLRYYNEVSIEQFLAANNIDFPNVPAPFKKEGGTVIAVNDGYFTELQFHFKAGEQFLNISMTPFYYNPMDVEELQGIVVDTVGNKVSLERVNASTAVFRQIIDTDGALVYRYYQQDEADDFIHVVATQAHEFYSYADGIIYHIGLDPATDVNYGDVDDFVKEFVLNNDVQTLSFEQKTFEENWLNSGGKTMLICLAIAIISFIIMHFGLRNRTKKVTKIWWTIMWLFVHVPILSWLFSFSMGIIYKDGFAAIGMLIISFPIFIVIGLILILMHKSYFIKVLLLIHIAVFLFAFSCSL